MEEDTKQELESAADETPPAASSAETHDSIAIRRAFTRLVRKRIKKFVALVPEVLTGAKPKTVHDARVWSRRVQQAVSAFFPRPRSGKTRRLIKTPRRIRRALGEWRNCDVLLEMVARQERRTRSAAKRRAWAFVRDYVFQKRRRQVARAGKKLMRQDLENYVALAGRLLGQPPGENPEILIQRLCDSVRGALAQWQSALARAQETRGLNDLHAFRVATKDLRYRTELLYDVGYRRLKAPLKWLADLQEALGVWHDRQVFHQAIAESVARPEILLTESPTARVLLVALEADRSRVAQNVEKIFRLAVEHPSRKQMESWNASPLMPRSSIEQ